jgi:hypothetical protein
VDGRRARVELSHEVVGARTGKEVSEQDSVSYNTVELQCIYSSLGGRGVSLVPALD